MINKEIAAIKAAYTMKVVGVNISRLLGARQMSASQLSRMIDVNRATVSRWISGEKYPSLENVHAVCMALGTTFEDLHQDKK